MLRAIVVDDERLARREMGTLLAAEGRVEVVAEAASTAAAVAAIERLRPDVVLLDIKLGKGSGFQVLEQIDADIAIIFVTAYDVHAVRAFDVNAVDYLLKPVDPRRLTRAIDRLSAPATHVRRAPAPEESLNPGDWIFVRSGQHRTFVRLRQITHLVATGDWVTLHLDDGRALRTGDPLTAWEARLPSPFLRIHRGTIVNLEFVARVEPWSHGTSQVWLKSGVAAAPLTLSRRYAARARTLLGAGR